MVERGIRASKRTKKAEGWEMNKVDYLKYLARIEELERDLDLCCTTTDSDVILYINSELRQIQCELKAYKRLFRGGNLF